MLVLHMHIHLPISYEGVPTHGADARPSHKTNAHTQQCVLVFTRSADEHSCAMASARILVVGEQQSAMGKRKIGTLRFHIIYTCTVELVLDFF